MTIVLTLDYELFLGEQTGNVDDCMIEPVRELASILKLNDSKMTIFWDISHYMRLQELAPGNKKCRNDLEKIKESILSLAGAGHDIQMHIHSHWINSDFVNDSWVLNYDFFRLHNLELKTAKKGVILDYLQKAVFTMEEVIKPVIPGYKVTMFRAGGYLLEPFELLIDAFKELGIRIDSSILPGITYNNHELTGFDYKNYPQKPYYRFNNSPKTEDINGYFYEIPVTTVKIPAWKNFIFRIQRKTVYRNLNKNLPGSSMNHVYYKKLTLLDRLFLMLKPVTVQFTLDSNFTGQVKYFLKKSPEYSVMIVHSKLFRQLHFQIMKKLITQQNIKFISLKDYVCKEQILE